MRQLIDEHLSATFYRRSYYRMMREIVGDHRSARHGRLYALDCALFLYAHRVLWIAYLVHTDFKAILGDEDIDTNNITQWNDMPLGYAYAHRETYDAFIFVGIYLFAAYYLFLQTTFWRLDPRGLTWLWWYELVVKNQDDYRDAVLHSKVLAESRRQFELRYLGPSTRRGVWVPSVAKRVYRSIVARVRLWWTLSNVDQQQLFSKRPLAIIPNLSPQLRRWSILFLVVTDYVALVVQTIIVILIFTVLMALLIYENKQMYSLFAFIWLCAEAYLTHYGAQRLLHCAFFFTNCSIIMTKVWARQVIESARPVREIIRRYRILIANSNYHKNDRFVVRQRQTQLEGRKPKCATRFQKSYSFSYQKYGFTIKKQLTDHNKVCNLLMRGSNEMFGNVLFAFLLANLPINVYIVQRFTFQTFVPLELIAMWLVFWLQTSAALAVIFLSAWCCTIFHSPKRFIPALQMLMSTARWLPYKLKYDDLYGRLGSGPKIGISIGPMEAITFKKASEFILLYIAFILMAFRRKMDMDLQRDAITKSAKF